MSEDRKAGVDCKHLKWKIKKGRDSAEPGAAACTPRDAAAFVWRCLASHRTATSASGRGWPLLTALQVGPRAPGRGLWMGNACQVKEFFKFGNFILQCPQHFVLLSALKPHRDKGKACGEMLLIPGSLRCRNTSCVFKKNKLSLDNSPTPQCAT